MSSVLFQQFARLPRPGKVKTRLHAALGPAGACEVHSELLAWTCSALLAARLGPVELWLDQKGVHPVIEQCLTDGAQGPFIQCGAGLGERMYHALKEGLERSAKVILVGSDCPQLDAAYLRGACEALDTNDCVLGPARDGGYVLIGVRRVSMAWFEEVEFGGARVFEDTAKRLEGSGTAWTSLALRDDIDRPEDLPLWWALRSGQCGDC